MEEFDQTHQVNLRSIISLSLLALPHLTKTKGNIVNVSSVAGWIPVRNFYELHLRLSVVCNNNR